ncbi:dTDP-4-dehydrorhamnose reductase [Desulfosarcina sp. OttesenSCG-928-A07]|nr:dTDP-4-dehydrorhamnose reductase [Desulfosarcina sp. OttesenSCG-928-G17]MDL2330117.1 dTDP-4-dehydrorhamnose reductase [Desulfosarcina sp. OttesenSCG-928-A07]
MKVLVIGGNGQLGKTLSDTVSPSIAFKALDLPDIDITSAESVETVMSREKPDVVINAAAYTAVDRAENEPEMAFAINAKGPENLALSAKKDHFRLIHISTDYVFDGTACTPYRPDVPCRPLGVYGNTKYQGEVFVQSILDHFIILRTAWLYSRYGANFVLTMLRLMKEKEALNVVVDQVGSPTWTGTLSETIWNMVEKPEISGIYHCSDAGVASWYDFAVAIQEEALRLGILEKKIPVSPILSKDYPTPAKRPSYSVLDCTQTWRDLDMSPLHWRSALQKMMHPEKQAGGF